MGRDEGKREKTRGLDLDHQLLIWESINLDVIAVCKYSKKVHTSLTYASLEMFMIDMMAL